MLIFGFLLLCVAWGTSWVAIKYSLAGFPPFLGAALRFVLAAVLLGLFAKWKNIPLTLPKGRARRALFVTGILIYGCNYGFIYWGEQYLSAGTTAVFFSTMPIFTALMSGWFLSRSGPSWAVYLGLSLSCLGIIVVFYGELTQQVFATRVVVATILILLSALFGAISNLMVKRDLPRYHPVPLTLFQMMIGIVLLLGLATVFGEWGGIRSSFESIVAIVYLAVIASAFAFALYYWLLQQIDAVSLSLFVYLTPLVAIFLGWFLLSERLSGSTLLGTGIIFAGIVVAQSDAYRRWLARNTSA